MSIQVPCPHCRATITIPGAGRFQCAYCAETVEISAPATATTSPPLEPTFAEPAQAPEFGPYATDPGPGASPNQPSPEAPSAHAGTEHFGGNHCANHPLNAAATTCERCGDFICRLCLTPAEGRAYCPKCFDLQYQRGTFQMNRPKTSLAGIALGTGIASMLSVCACAMLTPVIGGVGVAMGLRALQQYQRQPDLPGRSMATTGLVLSAVSIGLVVLMVVAFIGYFLITA